jgi:hypothetical protein
MSFKSATELQRFQQLSARVDLLHKGAGIMLVGAAVTTAKVVFWSAHSEQMILPLLGSFVVAIGVRYWLHIEQVSCERLAKGKASRRMSRAQVINSEVQAAPVDTAAEMTKALGTYIKSIGSRQWVAVVRHLQRVVNADIAANVAHDILMAQGQFDVPELPIEMTFDAEDQNALLKIILEQLTKVKGDIATLYPMLSADDQDIVDLLITVKQAVPRETLTASALPVGASASSQVCDLANEFTRYRHRAEE